MKKPINIIIFTCLTNIMFLSSHFSTELFSNIPVSRKVMKTSGQDCKQAFLLNSTEKVNNLPALQPTDDEKRTGYLKEIRNLPLFKKEVFLTFDDGPSRNNTPKILDILNVNNVKATFFVIGEHVRENPDIMKKLYSSGMSIVAHSHTHKSEIYKNTSTYLDDLNKCNETINSITKEPVLPFLRFPGGSDNSSGSLKTLKNIRKVLRERNLYYVDWNVSSSDAAAETVSVAQIKDNVMKQCKYTSFAVVLMHDSAVKETTVEALPHIIKFLKDEGYVFRTFKDITDTEIREMIKRGIVNR